LPSSHRSVRLTDAYRRRLTTLRDQLQGEAPQRWDSPERLATMVEQAQKASLRLTSAYLAAFHASETGKPLRAVQIDTMAYSGSTADGQPLDEGMRSPLIGYLAALKQGKSEDEARRIGVNRATRQVGINLDHAHRTALLATIKADDRFGGWTRVTGGTCAACAAKAGTVEDGLRFQVHAGCKCVSEPLVSGVTNRFPRPTGAAIFNAKDRAEQDEMLGPEAAEKVRRGELTLADLAGESPMDSDAPDWITQKPLTAV
jgi:hypothetical protein